MPRATKKTAKRTARPRSGPARPPEQVTAEPDAEPLAEMVDTQPAGIFDSFGDDSYTAVFWHNPTSKQQEYQGRLDINPMEQDVQEFCGGGKYTLREMARDEDTGRMMYRRQRTLTLAGEHFEPKVKKPDIKPEVGTRAAAPDSLTEAVTAQIINLMTQGQAMTQQQVEGMTSLFRMMQEQQAQPKNDATEKLLLALMQQQTTLLQAMITGKQSDHTPDPIAMVEKIGSVLKAAAPSNTGLKEALEAVSAIISLKTDVDGLGGGADEDPVIKLATTYLPKFFELAKTETDRDKFVQRARAMLPESTTPPEQSQQPKQEVQLQPWQQVLHHYRKQLLALAQSDADPEIQATAIANALPANVRSVLKNWLATESCYQDALAFLPEMQPYHMWVGRYLATLHIEFYPELYDDEGNLIAGGDDGQPSSGTYQEGDGDIGGSVGEAGQDESTQS